MAEILGLGITHQPPLAAGESIKPRSLVMTLQDPGLPGHLRVPSGWPERMRREWGEDEGATHAREHRAAIANELRKVRAVLDEFRPDVVIAFGDDQYENFKEDVVPPFCVLAYDRLEFRPWEKGERNYWGEPADKTFVVNGHRAAAKYLTMRLLEQSFDVAYAYRPLHVPLGHAFRNTILYLDWDRKGFSYGVIPFSVNCYGRTLTIARGHLGKLGQQPSEDELDPPSPSPARCFALGAACARAMAESPWRVALVASSSWSHAFLTEKNYHLYPDHEADEALYRALQAGDYAAWRERTLAAVEDSGQHEMLNWYCLVGAMAELKRKPDYAAFVESSVMNSNKVFATFRAA
jgi:Catalytic LigB subunit of aromatic ring-opening dioxygenase